MSADTTATTPPTRCSLRRRTSRERSLTSGTASLWSTQENLRNSSVVRKCTTTTLWESVLSQHISRCVTLEQRSRAHDPRSWEIGREKVEPEDFLSRDNHEWRDCYERPKFPSNNEHITCRHFPHKSVESEDDIVDQLVTPGIVQQFHVRLWKCHNHEPNTSTSWTTFWSDDET